MRIFILFFILIGFSYGQTSLSIKKGWQLIGVPTSLNIQTSFNNDSVDIIWGFDATSQSWMGYSPNSDKQSKILENYNSLDRLESWQAIWILSREDWVLEYTSTTNTEIPNNNTIELKVGWNLISIPQQIVVSDKFFGDLLVWKYSQDEEWSVSDDSLDFPSIETIALSQGLWVKSDIAQSINVDTQSSKLNIFTSKESMLSYIRQMIQMNTYFYDYDILPIEDIVFVDVAEDSSSDTTNDQTNATTTNLQEIGVDEADIIKNDGTFIFSVNSTDSNIIITSFSNISNQIYTPINTIEFENKQIISIYLQNNRLIVISNNSNIKNIDSLSAIYAGENSLTLDIFNVSDINNITLSATHILDGYYKDSRLVDGQLYLISQFNPSISYEYEKVYIDTICNQFNPDDAYANCSSTTSTCEEGRDCDVDIFEESCTYGPDYQGWIDNNCNTYYYDENGAYQYDYDNPIVQSENLIPSIASNEIKSDLVDPLRFYAPIKLNQQASITSVSSFNIENGIYNENISFLGDTHTYYASLTSLYLVSSQYPLYYDFINYKDQQMIYQFSLGTNLTYEGCGLVEGRMLNQFSMSQKDDYLRIATTSGWSWWDDANITNTIYTLKNTSGDLNVEGILSGLGHEGETIRAVRFMQDRGFVVTFQQTDPFYTIDLSDPTNPKKVGELLIPGYSEYLHIVDDNRVLSIGRNADEDGNPLELQFQLFDITDFANPSLASKIQIGNEYSYSDAEYNHKAFTYRSYDLMFGVPYRNYNINDYTSSEHFGVYQINGMNIDALHTITSESSSWEDAGRGLIFDLNDSAYGALFKGANIICEIIED